MKNKKWKLSPVLVTCIIAAIVVFIIALAMGGDDAEASTIDNNTVTELNVSAN